jgi:hypothetical protein
MSAIEDLFTGKRSDCNDRKCGECTVCRARAELDAMRKAIEASVQMRKYTVNACGCGDPDCMICTIIGGFDVALSALRSSEVTK